MDDKSKKIFISYGHDKYSCVAEKFALDFNEIYQDVFFDGRSLRIGERYDSRIENAIEQCDIVIFFMTKYSVRINNSGYTNADDSFCRDEIEYARSCKKAIIPVMLEDCQPPLIVHRLQYINGKGILGEEFDSEEFETVKEQLISVITDINKLVQYGESYSLMQMLNQFDNDAYSKGLIHDYTGRKWLAEKCMTWVSESHEKILCIIGEIGTGKSSFVTNLVYDDTVGYFAGIHYCRFDIESSIRVRNIVKSLTYSVATQIPGFSHYIEGISERVLETSTGTDLFEKLLVEPLQKISAHMDYSTFVIVIDAIDEISDPQERSELLTIISENSRYLPDWFKIIITSRPDGKLEYLLQDTTIIKIDTSSAENMKDVSDYIIRYSHMHNLTISDDEKQLLLKSSNGNFLYVYFALSDSLESGTVGYDGKKYPKGLDGIYARTINRKFHNIDDYESQIVPIFEILCATKAPISLEDLSRVIGESKRLLLARLQKVSAFVRRESDKLSFYHKSLAEWLVDWNKSDEYYIDSKEGEGKIVRWVKGMIDEFTSSEYCTMYGVKHLIENREYLFLNQLLQRQQFIIAETYSTELLEYVYKKQFDVIRQMVQSLGSQPSIVSFVVIRRLIDGAVNAGLFDSAICVNEMQKSIEAYSVFFYSAFGNIVLYKDKNIEQAKGLYSQALNLAEQRCGADMSVWNQFVLSVCYGRMGKIMVESLQLQEAREYYQNYLDVSIKLYNETYLIEILRNVAIGYERLGWISQIENKLDDALSQYHCCLVESQKIYDETKTVEALRGVAITYERLGRIAEIQKKYDLAVEYQMHNYTMSNEIYDLIGNANTKRGLANSCHCLGDAYLGEKKYNEAYSWFMRDKHISSEIYTSTDMIDDIRDYAICLDRLAYTSDMLQRELDAEDLFCQAVDLFNKLMCRTQTKKLFHEYAVECIRLATFYSLHGKKNQSKSIATEALTRCNTKDLSNEIKNYLTCLMGSDCNASMDSYMKYVNRRNTK